MEEINLLEVLEYFKSKVIYIIGAIVLALLIGNVYTHFTRVPMYKSNTTILLVGTQGEGVSQSDLSINTGLVDTYTEIAKSRRVLNQVIKNLGLDISYESLNKMVSVSTKPNTQMIVITAIDSDSKEARKIADEVSKVFAGEIKVLYNLDNVTIIDKAIEAKKPYNMTILKDNAIYFAAGLILSCGIIFIIYYFDTTIKSTEGIENKLGLTILGVVPEERRGR